MSSIETVKVVAKSKRGWRIINKCDMTKDHVLWEDRGVQSQIDKKPEAERKNESDKFDSKKK